MAGTCRDSARSRPSTTRQPLPGQPQHPARRRRPRGGVDDSGPPAPAGGRPLPLPGARALRHQSACGPAITLAGTALTARASGALWWPAERLLCVADLHLGKSERLARRGGALLPPYETAETLDRLAAEIAALAPARGRVPRRQLRRLRRRRGARPRRRGPAHRADGRARLDLDRRQPRSRPAAPRRPPPGRAPPRPAHLPPRRRPTPRPARSPATTTPSSGCRSAAAPSPGPASSSTRPG